MKITKTIIAVTLICFAFSGSLNAQVISSNIVSTYVGTANYDENGGMVTLNPQVIEMMIRPESNLNYIVMVTPTGDCGAVGVMDQGPKGFHVQPLTASRVTTFNYVIYFYHPNDKPLNPLMNQNKPQDNGAMTPSDLPHK